MKKISYSATLLLLGIVNAKAGNLDASRQSILPLFEQGTYSEVILGAGITDVSGDDPFGVNSGDMAADAFIYGGAFKTDFDERWSGALIFDTPFEAKARYHAGFYDGVGGHPTTKAITGLIRYKLNDNFSIYGGPRLQSHTSSADMPFLGYSLKTNTDYGLGYSVGMAYEIPEMAARVALTYNSTVHHTLKAYESGPLGDTVGQYSADTPQSVNLDFQTGIAPKTLLFGGLRWVDWSNYSVTPPQFGSLTGRPLLSYGKDVYTYTLGLGYAFTEQWSGAIIASYEPTEHVRADPLVPYDGMKSLTLAGTYTQGPTKYTAAVTYVALGDVATAGVGSYSDNDITLFTLKVAHNF